MTNQKSSHQKIQEEQYDFPYHYIPQYQNDNFQQCSNFPWGYEYLSYLFFVREHVKTLSPTSLLDVGCGDGRFLHEIHKSLAIPNLVGIDYSPRAIQLAKVLNPDILFIDGDIKNKEITKKTFDCITLIETLEHIPPDDTDSFLKGIHHLLQPQGKLLITVPSDNVPVTKKHYRHFNETSLKETLQNSFTVDTVIYLNKINSFRFNILKRMLTNPLFICNAKLLRNYAYAFYKKHCLQAEKNSAGRIFAICTPKK